MALCDHKKLVRIHFTWFYVLFFSLALCLECRHWHMHHMNHKRAWLFRCIRHTRKFSIFKFFVSKKTRFFSSSSWTSSVHAVWRLVSEPTWTKSKNLFSFVVCEPLQPASQPIIIIFYEGCVFRFEVGFLSAKHCIAESEGLNICSSHMFDIPRFCLILLIPWSFDVRGQS